MGLGETDMIGAMHQYIDDGGDPYEMVAIAQMVADERAQDVVEEEE